MTPSIRRRVGHVGHIGSGTMTSSAVPSRCQAGALLLASAQVINPGRKGVTMPG